MPSIVNPTAATRTFASTQQTYNYNNSGSDLIVTLGITSTSSVPDFSSVLYNGVSMTQSINNNRTTLGYREATFYLGGAAQGTNTLTINLTAVSGNPCQIIIAGVNNSAGVPSNIGSNGLAASPHSRNLTVSQDSILWCYSSAYQSITDLEIVGISETIYGNTNTNRYLGVAFSGTLNAGSRNFTASSLNQMTNVRIEIEDGGGGGGGDNHLWVC